MAAGDVEISEYDAIRLQNTDASTELEQDTTLIQLRQRSRRKPADIQVKTVIFRRLAGPVCGREPDEELLLLLDLDQRKIAFLLDVVARTP